jgi:putative FmdB family regulatory protein
MPIYGYRCRSCGHELEVLQKMSDPPLQTCPNCSGQLQKLIYPAGVIFKGSGFYSTDYKGSGAKASANGSDSGSESKSDSKPAGETKSESKPEGKSEPKTESKAAKSDSES